jgi:hypothetical protein
MVDRPIRKLTEEGRQAANVLSAHTLKVARPLFWHIGMRNSGVPTGGSAFILQFEHRLVVVTADHVIDQYFADLKGDDRTVCQLAKSQVWPEKSLIARSAKLDIATFEIEPAQIGRAEAETIDCRGAWPPPGVEEGDTLTLTGFLDKQRNKIGPAHYEMQAWGAHGIADAVTDWDIVTVYEPDRVLIARYDVPKPPLGFNMSGCSGGPALLVKQVNGSLRWFPVGLIYKGPVGKAAEGELAGLDRIYIRRIHFLNPDGTINEPDTGWLPN